ncbi:hypothetical protein SCHPADRAFT_1000023 [Schizopora paradoxa]|uniref:F-box domain-containing protein n=1 Tax=Schizopora paradoxa TaxID=27342 RepID=A0A0H2RD16_9AGAM|nr:hypothetical protein SCHPADRAFT_1000023 [Schizopora paradoxa]
MVPGEVLPVEEAKNYGKPAASSDLGFNVAEKLSVAQRLLPELLAEIFLFAVAEVFTQADALNKFRRVCDKDVARRPIVISHVCRSWREAALSVRSLWSFVEIHSRLEDVEGRVDRRCMSLFETYMRRSRGVPLTVFSVITPPLGPSTAGTKALNFADILWALSKQQNRWKQVYIHYSENSSYPKHPSRRLKLVNMPLLEELNLVLPFPLGPTDNGVVLDLSGCARLQRLQLAGEVSIVSNGTLLHNLTEVDLTATDFMRLGSMPAVTVHSSFPSVHDIFKLLRLAPNLELLLARLAPPREGDDPTLEAESSVPMDLPNMRRLILQVEGDEDHLEHLCYFLDHITIPNVYTFGLWCRLRRAPVILEGDGADEAADANNPNFADWWFNLPDLLERSSFPPITSFYIDSDVISQREVRDCMHMLPHLHDLTLVHVPWSARGALRLALDPQKVNLAPSLGVLRFIAVRFGGQKKLRMARVVKMIVSRWRDNGEGDDGEGEGEGGRLKQVVFVGCDVAGLEEHPEIKKCEEEGLKIECRGCI